MKVQLAGAGKGGTYYPDFTPFTVHEIRQHVGLYIFHNLSPTPKIEQKFQPQCKDPLHDRDFIVNAMGYQLERHHKHFKAFFSVQNPTIQTPSRKKFPNWKVRSISKWLNFICPLIWALGVAFSVDEMTMCFKGHHQDKKRITYKAEGDGFQCDALCQNGFTYQVYIRNDPAPPKYLKLGLSPLHSRVMVLYDLLEDEYHHNAMDNLYNLAAFYKASYKHPKKVLIHGVTRKGKRGIPSEVVQEEEKNWVKQLVARGTIKAAVLMGDSECPDLVASSVYDTKPVHFLSMACTELKWMKQEKEVYNVEMGEIETLEFLQMNNNIAYNKEMGNVDIADQLQGSYICDIGVRNHKWWWSLWFWGLGVMLVNAYIMYVKFNLSCGINKKDLLSHHEFQKQIALSWINERYELLLPSRTAHSKWSEPVDSVDITSLATTVSSLSSATTAKKKCIAFMKNSLNPYVGKLCCCLDRTVDHISVGQPSLHLARCQLHKYFGVETEKKLLYCPGCGVNICGYCYRMYHTIEDLDECKDEVLKH